jgi:tetratricopeptide (TPR) repeat protein
MRIKNSLVKRRLVHIKEVDGEMCFSIHRSLQRNIRDTLAQDEVKQQLVFDQAVALVREVFPQSSPLQQPTPDRWPEYQRLLPHLHTLHDAFYKMKPQIKGSTDLAKILSDAGMDQHERGITKEGLLLLRTAEDVLDSIASDPQDVMRADIHAVIAMMYDNTGIGTRTEALRRRQIALRIRQKVVDEAASVRRQDEVLLYNSHMELAIAHLHFHRYEEAEPIIEKCLQKYQEWGSGDDEPFEYAKYYNKMGLVRMYQGRFDEAIKLAEQGVRYMNKTGYTLFESRFKFDLACIVLQSGNIQEAMRLHREIFDARLDKLGQSNELTLHSRYAIGALYEIKGQPEEAE